MISIERLCAWGLIACLALLGPGVMLFRWGDELAEAYFICIALVDCLFNNNWKKYSLLWIIIGVIIFYIIYSIKFVDYNTTAAIIQDAIVEIKPFVAFAILYAVAPTLTSSEKKVIKVVSIVNCILISLVLFGGNNFINSLMRHPAFAGAGILLSSMALLYVSIDKPTYKPSPAILGMVILFLTIGLLCGRSKYYGIYLLSLFFFFVYKPGMLHHFKIKHILAVLGIIAAVIIAGWSKFEYYFLSSPTSALAFDTTDAAARPALYLVGLLILVNNFPFGSGLASFASFQSGESYSPLYYEYGLNYVWGLSPSTTNFICDAFYPSLAQFGVAGVILFILFFAYIIKRLAILQRFDVHIFKYDYIIGVLLILFLLIECIAGTVMVQLQGFVALLMLGVIASKAKPYLRLRKQQKALNHKSKFPSIKF